MKRKSSCREFVITVSAVSAGLCVILFIVMSGAKAWTKTQCQITYIHNETYARPVGETDYQNMGSTIHYNSTTTCWTKPGVRRSPTMISFVPQNTSKPDAAIFGWVCLFSLIICVVFMLGGLCNFQPKQNETSSESNTPKVSMTDVTLE